MKKLFKKLQLKYHFLGILVFMILGSSTLVPFDSSGNSFSRIQDSNIAIAYYIMLFIFSIIFLMLIINPSIKLHFLKELFILATTLNVVIFIYLMCFPNYYDYWFVTNGLIINLFGVIWNIFIYYYVIVKKVVTFKEFGKTE